MKANFEEIKRREDTYQLDTYKKFPLSIERGKGAYVYDLEGRRYLDLYGGHAVAVTGHCHPKVVRAVKEQAEALIFYSNVVYSSVRAEASKAIVEVAPRGMDKVFFCNSGAEANETAMKIARKFTGRTGIVAMKNGFHGRTMGALSATALGNYRQQFSPLLEGFAFAEFGDLGSVDECLGPDAACVILEPIQSMAGVDMAGDDYYRGLRKLCDERGALLIFDEVQTGIGRTGSWFFGDALGVVPDLITMAKGLGGGFPVGGVLIHERISKTIKGEPRSDKRGKARRKRRAGRGVSEEETRAPALGEAGEGKGAAPRRRNRRRRRHPAGLPTRLPDHHGHGLPEERAQASPAPCPERKRRGQLRERARRIRREHAAASLQMTHPGGGNTWNRI
jgi:acetylornithine/succinyldiaminopimelate/putrescine aminotransferase